MSKRIDKLHYFKYQRMNIVDKVKNNATNSKNITLNKIYCRPIFFKNCMDSLIISQRSPVKKDFRIKKNVKQEWEISDISDSQLWMQSRAFRGIIGIKIKTIREKQGISQMSLALRLGWDQGYQSRIEAGKVNICLITLSKIAIVLNSMVKFEEKNTL